MSYQNQTRQNVQQRTKKGREGKEGKKGVVTKGGAWGRKRGVMLRDVRNPLIAVALVSRSRRYFREEPVF